MSPDARGNNIYHANINGRDYYVLKNIENNWVVRTVSLQMFHSFMLNFPMSNNAYNVSLTLNVRVSNFSSIF